MLLGRYAKAIGAQGVQALVGLLVLGVLARELGPSDFGQYVVLAALVTISGVVVGAGAQAAMLVMVARLPAERASIHGASIAFAGVLLVVILAIATPLADTGGRLVSARVDGQMFLATAARVTPTLYASFIYAALGGAGSVGWMGLLSIAGAVTMGASALGAILVGDRLLGAVQGALVGNIAWAVCAFAIGARYLGLAPPVGRRLWRNLLDVGLPLHVGTVAYWLMLRVDAFVVNALIGGSAVGTYGFALSLAERAGLLTSPLYNATAAVVSGRDRPAALRTMLLVARVDLAIAAVLTLATLALGPVAVALLGGSAYAPAAAPLSILIIGASLLPIWPTVGLILVSQTNDAWLTARIQVLVASLAVVGYVIGISLFGVLGAATVSSGSYVLLVIVGLWFVRRRVKFAMRDLLPGSADYEQLGKILIRGRAAVSVHRSTTDGSDSDRLPVDGTGS